MLAKIGSSTPCSGLLGVYVNCSRREQGDGGNGKKLEHILEQEEEFEKGGGDVNKTWVHCREWICRADGSV